MEPWNSDDEQMAVRHADASGGDIRENQHEEDTMRDIHAGRRGSEGRQYDLSNKLRVHQRHPTHLLLWSILRVVRHKVGRGPYSCRSLRLMRSTRRMEERVVTSEKCWSGIEEKMPEISRKVNEMNWLRF